MSSPLSSVFEPGQKATKSAWVMGDLYHFFATKAEGAPNAIFEVIAFPMPPGQGHPPVHKHQLESETFIILSGEMVFEVNGASPKTFAPGSVIQQPAGTSHTFYPANNAVARFLVIAEPAGIEEMLLRIGTPAEVPLGVIPDASVPPKPEQMELFMKLISEYGITVYPPSHP